MTTEVLKAPSTFIPDERIAACEQAVGRLCEATDGKIVRVDNPYQAARAWWGRERAEDLACAVWCRLAAAQRNS